MVNISTDTNKTNNHLSLEILEHKKPKTYDVGNSDYTFTAISRPVIISCSLASITCLPKSE